MIKSRRLRDGGLLLYIFADGEEVPILQLNRQQAMEVVMTMLEGPTGPVGPMGATGESWKPNSIHEVF